MFLIKNKYIFGNENPGNDNPKTTSLQWFKFGIYLSMFITLIASAKISELEGASHHPAFMGNYRTISHTFYCPIYPVDKGIEDVGSNWDFILLFFRLNPVHCFKVNPVGWRQHLTIQFSWATAQLLVSNSLIYQMGECSFKKIKMWGQSEMLFCFVFGTN